MINWKKIDRTNLPDGMVLAQAENGCTSLGFLDLDDNDEVCCIGEHETIVGVKLYAYVANVPTQEELDRTKKQTTNRYYGIPENTPLRARESAFEAGWNAAVNYFKTFEIE